MGDSPLGFTNADAAWRMRLAKWVEPAKPSAEHVRRWVNFGTQPLHVGDSGSTGNPSKKIFQILWCSSWIIQPIFNLWPAPALAGIGNKALSAVDLAWPGWDFWPNSNVRNLKKSQKQSQGTKCIKISAQIIRMSTLDVREGRSPSRSCLHFAYLGGSSNEHQMAPGSLLGRPAISPHFDGPPMFRDKIDQGHPGPSPDVRPRYHRLETPSVWGFI